MPRSICQAAVAAALLAFGGSAAGRAHEIVVGQVLICDTQQQAERVGTLMHGDAQVALEAVNAEEHPGACGLAKVAYIPGATLSSVRTAEETFEVGPILVLGIVSDAGMQAVTPNVYFILRKIDERVA